MSVIAHMVLSVSTACWIVPRSAPALMARVSTGGTNIRLDAARMPALRDAASELAGMQGVGEPTRLTTQEDDINEDDVCIMTDLHMSSDYNSNSASQSLGAARLSTFLRREAARIDASLAAEEPLQVVEYGCATGGSSLVPLGAIQDSISNRPLRATMNDLPMNDWATLRSTVELALPNVDFAYAPTSMYCPGLEEATVHLAYSCFAQHWLSEGAPRSAVGQPASPWQRAAQGVGGDVAERLGALSDPACQGGAAGGEHGLTHPKLDV